jgi:hypothetical protein
MGQTQQTQKTAKIALSIIVAIIFFATSSSYFIYGGLPIAGDVASWFAWALPFTTIIATIMMLRQKIVDVSRGSERARNSIIFLVSFAMMILITLMGSGTISSRMSTDNYLFFYNNFYKVGQVGIYSLVGITLVASCATLYRVRSPLTAFMTGLLILGFLTATPVGSMIHPFITEFGLNVNTNIGGSVDSAYWVCYSIATAAMFARVILGKEQLRPV